MEQKFSGQNMRPILLAAGVILLFLGLYFFIHGIIIQNTYGRTTGVVVDFIGIQHGYSRGSGGEFAPKIRFTVKDMVYESLVEYSYFTNPFLKIGDRVNILYPPQKPNGEIEFDSFIANFGVAIVPALIGLLFISMSRSIKN